MTSPDGSTTAATVPLMDAAEARACVNAINRAIDTADHLVLALEEREGWRALGYASWRACAAAELKRSVATVYRMLDRARVERNLGFSHSEKRLPLLMAGDLARLSVDEQRAIAEEVDLTTAPRRHVLQLARVGKDAQAELARRRAEGAEDRRRLSAKAQPSGPPICPTFHVYRGDNREILPTLPANSVQLVVTSPGYGVGWNYADGGAADSLPLDEHLKDLRQVLGALLRVLRTGGVLALNLPETIHTPAERAFPLGSWAALQLRELGYLLREPIVWQHQDAQGKPMAFGTAVGAPTNPYMRRTREHILLASVGDYRIPGKGTDWPPESIEWTKDTWVLPPGRAVPGGPLVFPEELPRRLLRLFSEPGDVVLDPYAGMGTVGRVAREAGRAAWLIEREPSYWPDLETLEAA